MPLSWERHHWNNDLEWPTRWEGLIAAPGGECCILLENSSGSGDVVLTEYDTDGTSCIEPEDC